MMRKVACSLLLMAALCLLAAPVLWAQAPPAKIALLISASNFERPDGIPPLGDAADEQADAPHLQKALEARGFTVQSLIDAEASRKNIWEALETLATQAKPEDAIVLYFSGHGACSQEQFSLCPWDALPNSPVNDIMEGDLKEWLEHRLKARNVTLILDCCFSALEMHGKSVGERYKTKFMGRGRTGLIAPEDQMHISPDRAVILAAACPNGVALQIQPFTDARWIGLFTYQLTRALRHASPDTTYRSLMAEAQTQVQGWLKEYQPELGGARLVQKPMLHGSNALLDRPLFAPPGIAPAVKRPPLPVRPLPYAAVTENRGQSVFVDAPLESSIGIEYEATFKDEAGNAIGHGTMKKSGKQSAEVQLAPGTDSKLIKPGTAVVVSQIKKKISPADTAIVRLEGPSEFQAQMEKALGEYAFITVARSDSAVATNVLPRLVVSGEMNGGILSARLLLSNGSTPAEPRKPPYTAKNAAELVGQFSQKLYQLATLMSLMKLQNPNSPWVKITSGANQYVEGDHITFTLEATRNCHVFLYAIGESGYPCLLFPNSKDPDNFMTQGQTRPVGANKEFKVYPPAGCVTFGVLAIGSAENAAALKNRLLQMQRPEIAGKDVLLDTIQELQTLQLGDLDQWSVSELTVSTLAAAEVASKPGTNP